jgi:hypothetical protein
MARRFPQKRKYPTTEGAPVNNSPSELKEAYETQHTDKDRLDFVAFCQRQQAAQLELIVDMLNAIGQKVTNIDEVAKLLSSTVDDMRNKPNPLLKMMGMNLSPPPPGKLIH